MGATGLKYPDAGGSIYSGGAAPTSGQVAFSNGSALAGDSGLTYTAASDLLVVNHNAVALPAIPAADDTVIQVGGLDATTTRVLIDGFGGNPTFAGRMANGTNASKTAVVAGTLLVQLAGLGYDGSAYTTSSKASFQLQGLETWSGTQTGTKAILALTPTGTTSAVTALSVQPTLLTQVCTDGVTSGATVVAAFQHVTSGTAAIGFGSTLQVQGADDGGTQRVMSQITSTWTDAATATRSSKVAIVTSVNASLVNSLILSPTAATFQATDATTNTASTVANFTHVTSGTVANGFGTIIQLSGPDDGGTQRTMAQISAKWTTAATATRASQILFNLIVSAAQTTALTLNATSAQFASGFPLTISDTTDASSATAAASIVTGGAAVAKNIIAGQGIHEGITSTATAAGTTTLTSTSKGVQVFTGATTQTVQLPAANLFGAGISVTYTLINRSSGSVSWQRAGSDTINGGAGNVAVTTNTVGIIYSDGVSGWYTK
jgi:hypothetical protein